MLKTNENGKLYCQHVSINYIPNLLLLQSTLYTNVFFDFIFCFEVINWLNKQINEQYQSKFGPASVNSLSSHIGARSNFNNLALVS